MAPPDLITDFALDVALDHAFDAGFEREIDSLLYGIASFAPTQTYVAGVDGGEAGIATGGFGEIFAFKLDRLRTTAVGHLLNRATSTVSSGYLPYITASNVLSFACANGAGTATVAPTYQLTASDVGRILVVGCWHDGSKIRMAVGRSQIGDGTAIAGYLPLTGWGAALGNVSNSFGSGAPDNVTQFGGVQFRGIPTAQALADAADFFRQFGVPPSTIAGLTVTHRWSPTDEMRGRGYVAGQIGPAQLPDTITRAAIDAMGRLGSPLVGTADPARDGRRTLGVQGFSIASYLTTASGVFPGSVDGFSVSARATIWGVNSGNASVVGNYISGANSGFLLYYTTSSLRVLNGGTQTDIITYPLTAADWGIPLAWTVEYHGAGAWSLLRNGVVVGTATGSTYTPSAGILLSGINAAYSVAFTTLTLWELAAGNGAPTLAEVQAMVASDSLVIPNKTDHHWPLGADILAAGETVPMVFENRKGSAPLTRKGVSTASGTVRVQTGQSDYFRSVPGGGFRGAAAGTVVYWMGAIEDFTMAGPAIFAEVVSGGNAGWSLQSGNDSYSQVRFAWFDSSGAFRTSAQVVLSSIVSAGQIVIIHGVWTGAYLLLYVQGTQRGADTGPYAGQAAPASTEPMYLGSRAGTSLAPQNCRHIGFGASAGAPSSAQVAAHAAACLAAGRVLPFAGFDDRRFDFVQDIADAGGVLPAFTVDRAGSSDKLARAGAPLQMAQRTERTWGHESSPIFQGASGFANGSFLGAPIGACIGDPDSFFTLWAFILWPTTVSTTRVIAAARDDLVSYGCQLYTTGTNGTLINTCGTTGGDVSTSPNPVASGELGKVMLAGFCVNATTNQVQGFARRVALTSGSIAPGQTYRPRTTVGMTIGKRSADHWPAQDVTILGGWYGLGVLTLAEYQAVYDDFFAVESVRRVLSKVTNAWDVRAAARANGGVLPAQVADLVGSVPLAVNGSLSLQSNYNRAAAA